MSTANLVTFSGVSLTGTDVDDYTLTVLTQAATITAKALTYSGISVPTSKVYDGTTATLVSGTPVLQGTETGALGSGGDGVPYTGDDVSVTGAPVGTYNSKDVDTANLVTFSGASLTGTDVDDYTLTVLTQAATITPLAVILSGSRTYDGTTAASYSILTVSNAISPDSVEVASGSATLFAKDAGSENVTSPGTLTLGNNLAGDYTLVGATGSVLITPLAVTLSGTRVYDGTATASYSILTVSNAISPDMVDVASGSATLAGKDAGFEDITLSGTLTLGNNTAGDYTLTGVRGSVDITPKTLYITGLSALNKTYDATTAAALTGTASLLTAEAAGGSTTDGEPYTNDVVSLSSTVSSAFRGNFVSPNVGTGIVVQVTGNSLTGAQAGDYVLSSTDEENGAVTANITAENQFITFNPLAPVTYGTASVPLSATASSGLTVSFAVLSGPGAISGSNTLLINGAGNILISATQTGGGNFGAAPEVEQFQVVSQATDVIPPISFAPLSNVTFSLGLTVGLSDAGGGSTSPVVFTVLSGSGYTSGINGSTLTVTGGGTILIEATQAGDSNYTTATPLLQTYSVDPASQTISFTAPATPVSYGVSPITLTATASSGLAVAFTVVSGNGTVTGNVLTVTGTGSIVVEADQAGNASYSAAAAVDETIQVDQESQTISFTAPATPVTYGVSPIALTATASSGLPVTFSVVSGNGYVTSNVLTVTGAGTIVVEADQAGNSFYSAADAVDETIVVATASQTISFAPLATPVTYGVGPIGLFAVSSSGLPVTFSVFSGPGSISGSTLTVTGAGSIVVEADQLGNGNYSAAAAVQETLEVDQANQTITFAPLGPVTYGVSPLTLSATGGGSGNAVTFSVVSGPGSFGTGSSSNVLTVTGAGAIVIAADQAGNGNYNAAATVDQTLVVDQAGATITFAPLTPVTYGVGALTLSASSSSGAAIVFTVLSGPGTISGGSTLTVTGGGTILIEASQASDTDYQAAAPVIQTLTVDAESQTISFTAPATPVTYGVSPIALTATASSGLPVTFSVVSGNGYVTSNVLTVTGAGTIVVEADQAGNSFYSAADAVDETIVVATASQTISFAPLATPVTYGVGPIGLFAVSSSGLPVTFSVFSGPGSISGSTLTVTGAGSIVVEADQLGNGNYSAAAAVQETLEVDQANQTITFAPLGPVTYGVSPLTLSATGGGSGNAVTFSVVSGPGSFGTGSSSNVLTVTGAGAIVIAADQAGNGNYNAAATVDQTLVVDQAGATITFAPLTPVTYGVGALTLSASSSSGAAIVFTVLSGPGTISGGSTLTVTGGGTILIEASQASDTDYQAAAPVIQTLTVDAESQTISFTAPPTPTEVSYGVSPITLTATASSGLAVAFAVVSGNGTVTGNVLTVTGTGSIVVEADQAGNASYSAAAAVDETIQVDQESQTISFTAPATPVTYGVSPIALTATASSGLPVTFSVVSGNGYVTSNVLTVTGAGTIVVEADQAGNSFYSAADAVDETIVVATASQTISFAPLATPVTYGVSPIGLFAVSSSGLPVTFSVFSGPGSISGSTLTVTGAGSIVVEADQLGNGNYSAAAAVQETLEVDQANQTITFAPLGPVTYGVSPLTLSATGGGSGNAVTFSVVSGPGSFGTGSSSNVLTVTGAGAIVIAADQAGNGNYNAAATVDQTLVVDQAGATITFAPLTPVTYGVGALTLSASSSSGAAIVFTVLSGPGTISGGSTLTVTGGGTILIEASQASDTDYQAAAPVIQTLTVDAESQTISFTAPPTPTEVSYGVSPITLTATASSGLAVAFAVVSGNGTVTGNVLTVTGTGSIVVEADQAGNASYSAAAAVDETIQVDQESQTISFTAPATPVTYGVSPIALTATASSGLPVTFSVVSGNGYVTSNVLTVTGAGTIVVEADQAGNSFYSAADAVDETIVVATASQTISFAPLATPVTYGVGPIGLFAVSSSGLPVTFSVFSGPGSISGSTLTVTGAGSIVVEADQLGNGNYSAAAAVQETLEVDQANQTITFAPLGPVTYGVSPLTLSATGGGSGNAVTFSVVSGPGSFGTGSSSNVLTVTGAGAIVIAADQAGNGNYNAAATVDQTLVVDQAGATITFAPLTPVTYGVGALTLSASSSSGAAIVFTVLSGPGTISGGSTLTVTGGGTILIEASQASDTDYQAAAPVIQTLTVDAESQTISFTAPPTPTEVSYGVSPITLTATASSGLAVAFAVVSGNGTVTGNVLTVTGTGSIVVEADQAGNASYSAAAAVDETIQVDQESQTISFTAPATPVTYGVSPIALTATASSGLPVTFSVVSGNGYVTSNVLTVTGAGTIVVEADQAGNSFYSAADAVDETIVVATASQTISFAPLATPVTYGVGPIGLFAVSSSGLPVTFSVFSGPGSISGSTLTVTGAGSIVVEADQLGNGNYSAAAAVQETLEVDQANQTITFAPLGPVTYGVSPLTLSATGGGSGNAVTFSVVSGPGSFGTGSSSNVLTVTGAGAIVIAADQAGNGNYNAAATVDQTLVVDQAGATITFAPLTPVTYGVGGADAERQQQQRGCDRVHGAVGPGHDQRRQHADGDGRRHDPDRGQPGQRHRLPGRGAGDPDADGRRGEPDDQLHGAADADRGELRGQPDHADGDGQFRAGGGVRGGVGQRHGDGQRADGDGYRFDRGGGGPGRQRQLQRGRGGR